MVAIDVANHGGTQGLPTGGANFEEYTKLLGRVVDELGINKAVFAGHSMGGRLVTELAAREPDRALAVILLDAIVGEPWDRIVAVSRFNPFVLAGVGRHPAGRLDEHACRSSATRARPPSSAAWRRR